LFRDDSIETFFNKIHIVKILSFVRFFHTFEIGIFISGFTNNSSVPEISNDTQT